MITIETTDNRKTQKKHDIGNSDTIQWTKWGDFWLSGFYKPVNFRENCNNLCVW